MCWGSRIMGEPVVVFKVVYTKSDQDAPAEGFVKMWISPLVPLMVPQEFWVNPDVSIGVLQDELGHHYYGGSKQPGVLHGNFKLV